MQIGQMKQLQIRTETKNYCIPHLKERQLKHPKLKEESLYKNILNKSKKMVTKFELNETFRTADKPRISSKDETIN